MEKDIKYERPSTIRIIRESNGFSQEYVASKLEITQQAYSNIEKNPENASVKRLKQISSIFSVPVTSLIGESEHYVQQNFQQQGGQAATIIHVQGMPENERQLYERLIEEMKSEIQLLKSMLEVKSN
ncbi:MAG: helix-turn-helix domain-containing protein [Bacteroidia bacterium]|nr:helix-turn-helix domain-containing protein [Bacteroidia bacterium]